jgi:hypothetical protein
MSSRRQGRWFQFSLRWLFLVILVIAAFFAGYSLAERRLNESLRAAHEAQAIAEGQARQNAADAERLHALFRNADEVKLWQELVRPSPGVPDR